MTSDLAGRVLIAGVSIDAVPAPRCVVIVRWLARLGADGTIDGGFGSSGSARLGIAPINALALDGRQRIVAAGTEIYAVFDDPSRATVYRLLDDGSADPSFRTYSRAEPLGWANALALDRAGRILVAGAGPGNDPTPGLVLGRLLPTGLPDRSFGRGGYALDNRLQQLIAKSLALDPRGGLIVAADDDARGDSIALVRFGSACSGLGVIRGTSRADQLRGTNLGDVIAGYAGDDRVNGRSGGDAICAASGADLVRGGAGNDRLLGESGPDQQQGGAGADTLVGGAGDDLLLGGPGRDTCFGGPGHDRALGCELHRGIS